MARTLWAFNIKRAVGGDGKEIEPVVESQPGFNNSPSKFRAVLEPRSKQHAEIVERNWLTTKTSGVDWSRKRLSLRDEFGSPCGPYILGKTKLNV